MVLTGPEKKIANWQKLQQKNLNKLVLSHKNGDVSATKQAKNQNASHSFVANKINKSISSNHLIVIWKRAKVGNDSDLILKKERMK